MAPPRKKNSFVKILDLDPADLGPAMLALTDQQRKWVVAFSMSGDALSACRSAGYAEGGSGGGIRVKAHNLQRNPRVIEALQEWSRSALSGNGAMVAIKALIEIASDKKHRKRFDAADSLADRVGFARQSNHHMTVEHTGEAMTTTDILEALDRIADGRRPRPQVIEAKAVEVSDG